MDRKGNMKFHTRLKLKIYEEYLKAYISILNTQSWVEKINIIEPFAGQGMIDTEKGSAVIARDVILQSGSSKTLLLLNELNNERAVLLSKNTNAPENLFINISNEDANNFLSSALKFRGHALLFVDPFGYTQLNKDTYDIIFKKDNMDTLIFIPIYHIFRFLKGEETDSFYRGVAKFLEYFNISSEVAQKSGDLNTFTKIVRESIQKEAGTEYVYYKALKHTEYNSHHAVFFISRKIKGAEKFLEAADNAEKYFDNQGQLFSSTKVIFNDEINELLAIIKNRTLSNKELYSLSIRSGILPKYTREIFEDLEKEQQVTVSTVNGFKRRGKSLYINDGEIKVEFSFGGKA
jgi:three-Cys-motif partner protein